MQFRDLEESFINEFNLNRLFRERSNIHLEEELSSQIPEFNNFKCFMRKKKDRLSEISGPTSTAILRYLPPMRVSNNYDQILLAKFSQIFITWCFCI